VDPAAIRSAVDSEEACVTASDVPRSDRSPTAPAPSGGDSFTIDCDECAVQGTDACADCVVTFICSREPGEAVVVDVAEARAIRLLSGAGLLPELRHVRRTG
jgi:hypothetical protein